MDRYGTRNRRDHITSRLRLRDYDYSTPGYYFVTICCHNRVPALGSICDHQLVLNTAGQMVNDTRMDLPNVMKGVTVDCKITMPNHIHALIGIGVKPTDPDNRAPLTDVVQWYKSITTTRMIRGVKELGWPRFDGHLWQQRFHDHIVRNERELEVIRNYIATSPERWEDDSFHVE